MNLVSIAPTSDLLWFSRHKAVQQIFVAGNMEQYTRSLSILQVLQLKYLGQIPSKGCQLTLQALKHETSFVHFIVNFTTNSRTWAPPDKTSDI